MLQALLRRGSVQDGRVQVRGGVRRPHALPAEVRARGAVAYPAASSTSWPTALDGAGRPGILARRPCHGCGSRPHSGSGSSGGLISLYTPFLDPRGHQRACTGKRPVSRGEARLAYNSGGDEASFTSGVPHHTPPDLPVSAPRLSHTPTPVGSLVKGDVKGRGDDDDKRGRQQTRHRCKMIILCVWCNRICSKNTLFFKYCTLL